MTKKPFPIVVVKLDKIVGGGQTIATEENGRKLFVWGGLPDETVEVQLTKKKSKLAEGVVIKVIEPSSKRIPPRDKASYLSTSPWQIMDFDSEQHYKAALIEEAFELHDIVLPSPIDVYTDEKQYEYRNKIEFSWWWDKETQQLDLSFFKRGSHGKIPVDRTSLAHPSINRAAIALRDLLRKRPGLQAFDLKTVIIRCDSSGNVVMQLYVKDRSFAKLTEPELIFLKQSANIIGFETIFSNPQSPASVITERLQSWGTTILTDEILGVPFSYSAESFFQINLPVYIQALNDMKKWVNEDTPTIDLYSGVGTIGLTIGGRDVTLIEINESAVHEMKRNIKTLGSKKNVRVVLASSENALEYIAKESEVVVDPPRAGLHKDVIEKLIDESPKRIIYLSCNPVTQARDTAMLAEKYGVRYHMGYNFFPRTPHIEHLIILELKNS
ncbi:MAG TPA: 23S rRNA (uracil(1939)-C(5))-methyltransferase RlmD [Candidatus Saccharimonadales bacterium]|nr:23S rRNA (uracil(1939)-C(5))-methyltransferase RlmD [Candidatus Saccharimonadales bacterium]